MWILREKIVFFSEINSKGQRTKLRCCILMDVVGKQWKWRLTCAAIRILLYVHTLAIFRHERPDVFREFHGGKYLPTAVQSDLLFTLIFLHSKPTWPPFYFVSNQEYAIFNWYWKSSFRLLFALALSCASFIDDLNFSGKLMDESKGKLWS